MTHCWETSAHTELLNHAKAMEQVHLKELLQDASRNDQLYAVYDGIHLDLSRQRVNAEVLKSLVKLSEEVNVAQSVQELFNGSKINSTENRAVMHPALRAASGDVYKVDGQDVTKDVLEVRQRIKEFSDAVRGSKFTGHSNKALTDVVCIGIGGSYLGVEFVLEALKTYKQSENSARGRRIRFLANVDPIDVSRAFEGLNPETTLIVVISKTFTTAETMLNARTARNWILNHYNGDAAAIARHFCAVSTALNLTSEFGLKPENVFGFWDWVGGRFSVSSAVGVLPLSLQYGYEIVEEFLNGARDIDQHFRTAKAESNIPYMMGLMSVWNASYMKWNSVAVLPYCQALHRFPAHIQQLTMESNGKRVCLDGHELPSSDYSGEMYFGEPGTNGQHSFYQLIHQGRVIPCEFIGFTKSQCPISMEHEPVTNHQELMSNFFAQPDALALGKSAETLKSENVPANLIAHKTFPGNRPSTCLLFEGELTPRRVGQLLAIYEHRTAVEGFIWGINSFDQWGVELGKVLAKSIRSVMEKKNQGRDYASESSKLVQPTQNLLNVFLSH